MKGKIIAILIVIIAVLVVIYVLTVSSVPDGNIITTTAGGEFSITLDSNATTGYMWMYEVDTSYIEPVSSDYIAPESTELVGVGGQQVFTFRALQEGETEVSFSYLRPWESVQPIDQKTYVVRIR